VAFGGAAYNGVFRRARSERILAILYFLYSLLLAVAFVLAAPVYLWRGRGTAEYLKSLRQRRGHLPGTLNPDRQPSIWVHAVSVGEVLAARPLVRVMKERAPLLRVFVSTTTLTGQDIAGKGARDADGVFFAPFDFPGSVRRALDSLNPSLLVLVETEIWPNLIHEAKRRGTRVAIVNGRLSERSHSGYRRIRPFLRRVLEEIDLFLMQSEAHAGRIRDLGAPTDRVHVTGNLKFDALETPRTPDELARLLTPATRAGRPLVVAGSTVEGEEELVLAAFREACARVPEAGLVLAPRHPERFTAAAALVTAAGFPVVRRTALAPGALGNGQVVLLDTIGELAQVYPLASVVFVGGSLVPRGGHNVLEAAVAGKPVIVGPHMHNFQEIADEFRAEEAIVEAADAAALGRELVSLLTDEPRRRRLGERARGLLERNRGALARTGDALAGLLA
jgi:3-deoxy-D-manno-octulosonic-acid transferase